MSSTISALSDELRSLREKANQHLKVARQLERDADSQHAAYTEATERIKDLEREIVDAAYEGRVE